MGPAMKITARAAAVLLCVLLMASCGQGSAPADTTAPPHTQPTEATHIATAATTGQTTASTVLPPERDDVFVCVTDFIPDLVVELKYSTADNFTGQVIYEFSVPYLRYGTVKKLMAVQARLSADGLGLKLWDGFRPPSAQFKLWEVCPDPTYVSDPNNGFSSHSRGNTVDITLVDSQGRELEMPTGFDDFSSLADRDYSDCRPEAEANARYLEAVMTEAGFKGYFGEWWHYTDLDNYEVEHSFVPD